MTASIKKDLKKIVKRMRKIQKSMLDDHQPVSALQLEELTQLGRQYAETVESLKSSANLSDEPTSSAAD